MLSNNQLLGRLCPSDFERITANMRPVELSLRKALYAAHSRIESVYFLNRGMASAMTVMEDGSAIEVATIGMEGVVGIGALLSARISPNEVMIQIEGEGLQMSADDFEHEAASGDFRRILLLYSAAYQVQVSYAVACNGLHPVVKRCCRWILMCRDRTDSDELPLTHEFLSIMLGVRRATVSEILAPLQDKGLVANHRGFIRILDRPGLEKLSCECYRRVREAFEGLSV
jgi:CRP-like cAMP-binding protein